MRCKGCGYSTTKPNFQCWKKYQLCGDCATKEHPEEFPPQLSNRSTFHTTSNQKKTSLNPLGICDTCNNVLKHVRIYRKHTSRKINVTFCIKCQTLTVNDPRIKVVAR